MSFKVPEKGAPGTMELGFRVQDTADGYAIFPTEPAMGEWPDAGFKFVGVSITLAMMMLRTVPDEGCRCKCCVASTAAYKTLMTLVGGEAGCIDDGIGVTVGNA